MPIDFHVWRVDGDSPAQVPASNVPLEKDLEDMLYLQPDMLGETLLVVGGQVPTGRGFTDLLTVDSEVFLNVIELKRDRTPREVTAQILDYGAWVSTLTHDQVKQIYARDPPESDTLERPTRLSSALNLPRKSMSVIG